MRHKSLRDLENSVAAKIRAEKPSDLVGLWGAAPLNPEFQAIAAELSGRRQLLEIKETYTASHFPCLSGILRPYRHPKDTLQ